MPPPPEPTGASAPPWSISRTPRRDTRRASSAPNGPSGSRKGRSPSSRALAERFANGDAQLEEAATQAGRDHEVEVTGDDPPGTWRMPASLILLQAVNHGTEHRSQVSTILTQLGVEPPEMDGWTYFFASGKLIEV